MRVVCSFCDKAYQVPDHKIPIGKKVKARCKACDNAIVIERKPRSSSRTEPKRTAEPTPGEFPSSESPQTEPDAPDKKQENGGEDHEYINIQSIDPRWSMGNFMAEHGRLVYTSAVVLSLLILGIAGFQLYDYVDKRYFGGETRAYERYVRQVAEQIKASKSFPEKINNQVELTGIEPRDGKLVYLYTFLNFDSSELNRMPLVIDMRSSLREPICLGYLPGSRDDTLTYAYDVYGNDNEFVSSTIVDIADCR